jgi:DNA polymerase-4
VSATGPAALERTILHVDMDSFFAAVEVLVDPSLAGKPVIVGGAGDRGVVASCSYEARVFGIHSAMPSAQARRLCPHATFVHGHYDLYSDYSRRLHDIFESFTPLVEGISLDEAFLDVSGARRLLGDGEAIGWAIRAQVKEDLGLWCAVGVAPSKFVAKLASKAAKPKVEGREIKRGAGVLVVPPEGVLDFLRPLPVEALWGVGPATAARLKRMGALTVGDLADLPAEQLSRTLGQSGRHLHELSWGRDPRSVEPVQAVKSVGHEETYAHDHHEHETLHKEAVRMADAVAQRLRTHALAGRTVVLKVRFHDFDTITRSHTLPSAVDTGPAIARAAASLLDQVDVTPGVRLLGVSVTNLVAGGARQLSLEDVGDDALWSDASAAIDAVRKRFGDEAVGPAALVDAEGLKVKRRGAQQWGPGARGRTDR